MLRLRVAALTLEAIAGDLVRRNGTQVVATGLETVVYLSLLWVSFMPLSQNEQSNQSVTVNLRVEPEMCDIIDAVAKLHGKSRTAFMLDAAHQKAQDTLLDQRLFRLDEPQCDAFIQVLDAPISVNAALAELLSTPAPWE